MPNQALRDELLNDPDNIGYAGKTHQEMADLLNENRVFRGKQKIECERALWEMAKTGTWGALLALIEDAAAPQAQRRVAQSLRDVIMKSDRIDGDWQPELDALGAMLSVMVDAGVMSGPQRLALLELRNIYVARAENFGVAVMTVELIADALADPAP